jgi:sugar lactone lactonase YvrE
MARGSSKSSMPMPTTGLCASPMKTPCTSQACRASSIHRHRVFFDMTRAPGEDAIDGLKVDQAGNLYVCGPGGIWT